MEQKNVQLKIINIKDVYIDEVVSHRIRQKDEAAVLETANSILSQGLLQPLLVQKSNPDVTKLPFTLVDGAGRTKAIELLIEQEKHDGNVPVMVVEQIADVDRVMKQLIANNVRKNSSKAENIDSLLMIKQTKGWTNKELSDNTGISEKHLNDMFKTLRLPDPVRDMISNEVISLQHGKLLSQLVNKADEKTFNEFVEKSKVDPKTKKPIVPAKEMSVQVSEFLQNYTEAQSKLRAEHKEKFIPVPKLLSKQELEGLWKQAEAKAKQNPKNETFAIERNLFRKIFSMDDVTIAAKEAEWQKKKKEMEDTKKRIQDERETKKAQETIAELEKLGYKINPPVKA